jgi:hypothetical protein
MAPPQLQELGTVEPFLRQAGVFARMSPDDKRTLMELLGDGVAGEAGDAAAGLGHHVGFCGDGANDVGALKAAHVGVSLCEAEASVAAPLTSKRQTIACMVTVIAEGRCSLVTSYIIFKFIIVYAFIQASGWAARRACGCGLCGRHVRCFLGKAAARALFGGRPHTHTTLTTPPHPTSCIPSVLPGKLTMCAPVQPPPPPSFPPPPPDRPLAWP